MSNNLQTEVHTKQKRQATEFKLIVSLVFDAIGMLSYSMPVLAESTDLVWAPIAGFVMTMLYRGTVGKVAGVITFLEEILPFSDVIPSFTITWLYEYYQDKKNGW